MRRPLFALVLSFPLVACLAADPGVEGLTRGEFTDGGSHPDAGKPGDAGQTDGSSQGDAAGDGSTAANAFTGATAYAATQPPTRAVQYHQNGNVGVTPGKNQDCLSCHKMGGPGPVFLFAGTVFQDQNGTTPAAAKEIRVRGSDGKAFSTHSDSDGNFWYEPAVGEAIAFPMQAGVRDATNTALMTTTQTASSCNASGCHDGTTQAYLHLP